ncbi:MAG: FtsX-like permease family protein [Eubacterium sp.]|nr:FtsX-like permease family protein [Eubacterium sp.]
MGYKVVEGRLPEGDKAEIAISEYMYKTFEKAGYVDEKGKKEKISSYKDLVGKNLKVGEEQYKIVGIIDTKVDFNRYKSIIENPTGKSSAELLTTVALSGELERIKQYSISCVAIVGEGKLNQMKSQNSTMIEMNQFYMSVQNGNYMAGGMYIDKLSSYDLSKITWIDGEKKVLGEKELIISKGAMYHNENRLTQKELVTYLKENPDFTLSYSKYNIDEDKTENGWKIVGIADVEDEIYILPDKMYDKNWSDKDGEYNFAVASMPKLKSDVHDLVKYCYTAKGDTKYKMQNSVTYELDTVDEVLKVLSKVFLYVGLGFAIFAAIMLSNFIATSISYKKQEIGILRAIGARSNDVFKIFFSESFVIAMINFSLAVITTGVLTSVINSVMRKEVGILITILNFGLRQVGLLLVISIAIAAVASFIPVYRIASKKPIEAIRNR